MEQCDNEAEGKPGTNASRWLLGLSPAELAARQDLYNGFGNGLALAFELALVPAIFGAIGYGLDRWLGLLPVLTIALVLLAVAGLAVRQFAAYTFSMKLHEDKGPWAEGWKGSATDGPTGPPVVTPASAAIFRGPAGRQRRRNADQQVAS